MCYWILEFVENLQGSGRLLEKPHARRNTTLSYVTGRDVIGAYLVRLGQRVIQMKEGPIILTGYSTLNKLLGRDVTLRTSWVGLRSCSPMVCRTSVEDDQQGAPRSKWLSFVPRMLVLSLLCRESADPVDRPVWRPTPRYDPTYASRNFGYAWFL
jgi:acetyl-CoA carboxylase/biotin carboxylase 1